LSGIKTLIKVENRTKVTLMVPSTFQHMTWLVYRLKGGLCSVRLTRRGKPVQPV